MEEIIIIVTNGDLVHYIWIRMEILLIKISELYYAAIKAYIEIVQLFLNYGVDDE